LLARVAEQAPDAPLQIAQSAVEAPRTAVLRELVRRSWTPLTRRADRLADLLVSLEHARTRLADGRLYVYYPQSDPDAGTRLRAEADQLGRPDVVVAGIPRHLDARLLRYLDEHPGLLYLPEPYIVPGGRFHEMYGWDSYFLARGALADA